MSRYATRLIKTLRKYEKRKVVDLADFRSARATATALNEEATSDELLAGLEPEHKVLAAAHNLMTVQFEVISELPEMHRFAEAYVNHRPDVIFLAGLPDVDESRPHSRVNNDRW